LAGQLAVGYIELEQAVARRQGHAVHIAGVPGRNDVTAGVGIVFQTVYQLADLVDQAAVRRFPATPLFAVDRAEITVLVGPFVPDSNPVFLQVGNVGIALEEPQQFVNDGFQVQFLCRDHREAFGKVEAHLPAKDGTRAGAGAVGFVMSVLKNVAHQVMVGLH